MSVAEFTLKLNVQHSGMPRGTRILELINTTPCENHTRVMDPLGRNSEVAKIATKQPGNLV